MRKLLVVLQNAYGVEEGYVPSFDKPSFFNSHTGRRLREVMPPGAKVEIVNASPLVGDRADSCFAPDWQYVDSVIRKTKPTVILACGKMAQKAMASIDTSIPVIEMPHPAYRLLSKKMTRSYRRRVEEALR
jgi:hypothetical protein